jgi:Pyruvate/2-oxoacid:ferredoxin oxidoreductase delta subunit
METEIFYYTGTGNSMWAARKIAERIGETKLIPLASRRGESFFCSAGRVGVIFPVHIWGVPPPVIRFMDNLKIDSNSYVFSVAVNAGQVARSLVQLKELLEIRNIRLGSGFSIDLPSNYIPWGGAISPERQHRKFIRALDKIGLIAAVVLNNKELPPEKGPFWQNIIFSAIYRASLPYIPRMDKSFWADEKCNACGICEKVCPAANIVMEEGSPRWRGNCDQCFACLQWCPECAIQYGKGTAGKKRYHHPEVSLKDMLRQASG